MEGNSIRIIITGVLFSLYIAFGCPEWLHSDSWYIALMHNFFHANIFHLVVNCLSIWVLFRKGVRYTMASLIWAFIICSSSWFFTSADTIGFSNFIFATIGLRTPSLKNAWWIHPSSIIFFTATALMALLPQVSGETHLISFILGCIAAGAHRIINSISSDFRRASYNK